ncbi:hypothetical protein SOVF_045920 [Spinacia oleracea]|uniref:Uncharacterized protein C6G9.01c n=1 Tax=Spinacia oleracea TaxID=3562 RepID=A0A9R0IIE6_SPIOL|nr:uncharacterized protein C6G9.01c [Spinacia oleracea]KNA21150.1 hypothetical protein SOVF_045920 [Spinacia oleracea]
MPKKKPVKVSTASNDKSNAAQEKPSNSSKKAVKVSTASNDKSNAAREKPSTSSKKADEIDDIFASLKRKKSEQEKAEKSSNKNEKPLKIKKKLKRSLKENEALNPDSKPRRRTNDGLVIYSEEELKVNSQEGGNTGLCPFDCSCCF